MLIRHFYISEIAPGLSDLDVQVILGAAQVTNRRLDLTGVLVQGGGHFAQVLEGREPAVQALMSRIRRDARHLEVRTLLAEPIQTRQFARWAMGMMRRDDMAEALARAHRHGCAEASAARGLVLDLTTLAP